MPTGDLLPGSREPVKLQKSSLFKVTQLEVSRNPTFRTARERLLEADDDVVVFRYLKVAVAPSKEVAAPDGELTTEFKTIPWSPKEKGYTEHDLVGAKARIYSHDYPPDAPVAAPRTVQRIQSGVNFLVNQQGQVRR